MEDLNMRLKKIEKNTMFQLFKAFILFSSVKFSRPSDNQPDYCMYKSSPYFVIISFDKDWYATRWKMPSAQVYYLLTKFNSQLARDIVRNSRPALQTIYQVLPYNKLEVKHG